MIRIGVEGAKNLLAHYKMADWPIGQTAKDRNVFRGNELEDILSATGGFVELLVKLNAEVKKGQKVAIQRNVFGDVVHEYSAGVDGRVAIIGTDAIRERGVNIVTILASSTDCPAEGCPTMWTNDRAPQCGAITLGADRGDAKDAPPGLSAEASDRRRNPPQWLALERGDRGMTRRRLHLLRAAVLVAVLIVTATPAGFAIAQTANSNAGLAGGQNGLFDAILATPNRKAPVPQHNNSATASDAEQAAPKHKIKPPQRRK